MGLPQNRPKITRLRWVRAGSPEALEDFCRALGQRILIQSIIKDGDKWVMMFIPGDWDKDVKSGDI